MSLRQMLPFLFLNIVVSAVVVLSILFWWEGRNGTAAAPLPTATLAVSGVIGTPAVAAPPSGATPVEATPAADGPTIHVVAAGENLGRIAEQYDVSIDDIMLANGLTDPNIISVGQQLTIPIGGVATPTSAAAEAPTEIAALPSPIPTEAAATGQGEIAVTGVLDPGVLETEAVQLVNNGGAAQDMNGWKVRDEDSNVYTFGQVQIFGEGAGVVLHTRAGNDSPIEMFWGLDEPAWRSGETLTLWDAADQVVATFVVP